jgi:chromate transporter
LLLYFLGLGSWGFGGPIATVGYMQRDLVEERRWMARQDLLYGIALGQTMPGPLAAQVAMWVGYLRRGVVGAISTGAAFILPSFVMVMLLAAAYVRFQGLHFVHSLFYSIGPAVIAIIILAAWRLASLTDARDPRLWVMSLAIAIVTAATGTEVALVILAAGLVILFWDAPPRFVPWSRITIPLFAAPLQGVLPTLASGGLLLALFLFFLKAGAFIFGSGLAIVPFLREGVVVQNHWLSQRQFLDAVAVGLITPGPVVITAVFIGYVVAGVPGAFVSAIGIFLPIFLGVVIPGRWFVRHRGDRRVHAFVMGATAGAVGAIAGATVVLARQAIVDAPTALIAVASLVLLWRFKFKLKEPIVILAAGALGLLLRGI